MELMRQEMILSLKLEEFEENKIYLKHILVQICGKDKKRMKEKILFELNIKDADCLENLNWILNESEDGEDFIEKII
jgi:hypothetical protein